MMRGRHATDVVSLGKHAFETARFLVFETAGVWCLMLMRHLVEDVP